MHGLDARFLRRESGISVEFSEPAIPAAGPVLAFAGSGNSEAVVRPRTPVFLVDGLLSSDGGFTEIQIGEILAAGQAAAKPAKAKAAKAAA